MIVLIYFLNLFKFELEPQSTFAASTAGSSPTAFASTLLVSKCTSYILLCLSFIMQPMGLYFPSHSFVWRFTGLLKNYLDNFNETGVRSWVKEEIKSFQCE